MQNLSTEKSVNSRRTAESLTSLWSQLSCWKWESHRTYFDRAGFEMQEIPQAYL